MMRRIFAILCASFALFGCEDNDSASPEQDGDQQVYITNNLDDDIRVEYKNEHDVDIIEIVTNGWIDSQDRDGSTIPAHTTGKLTLYFNEWGMGHVAVHWGDKTHTFSVPVEIRNISVDTEDFD